MHQVDNVVFFVYFVLGAIYCQILDAIRPGCVSMRRVRWDVRFDYEYLSNYKLLQRGFVSADISREIPVDRLTKGRYQDNLEMCQFLMALYTQSEAFSRSYDPLSRRLCSGCKTFPEWTLSLPTRSSTAQLLTAPPSPVPLSGPLSPRNLFLAERERDFYLSKLEKIETVCKRGGSSEEILQLMYSMTDIEEFVASSI